MGTVVGVLIIIGVICVLFISLEAKTDDSKDRTKLEKYGKATGHLASSIGAGIAEVAHSVTESSEHKRIRLAEERIADYRNRYLRKHHFGAPYNPELDYDNSAALREALTELGISKEKWILDSGNLIQLSSILDYVSIDTSYGTSQSWNKQVFEDDEELRNALKHFGVSYEDWEKYGTKVLVLYDLYKKNDINQY